MVSDSASRELMNYTIEATEVSCIVTDLRNHDSLRCTLDVLHLW